MTDINILPETVNQNGTNAKRAVILVRVSSKDQEEGYSLDAQRFRLEQYCKQKQLEIIKIFELTESSTVGDRKKFMAMIDFIKSQKETIAVVVDKVDRLQRSFKETPLLDNLVQQDIIELHFNTENTIIHKNSISQERMLWNFSVIMAQSYIDNMRDNIKRSIEHKLRRGECITAAPIGYHNTRDENGKSHVVIDPKRAPLIKELFEEYSTGLYSLNALRAYSKKIGLRNSRRNQTYLGVQQIHQMLNQPFYYGEMRIKEHLYTHIYDPIISRDLFDRCTAIREGRGKNVSQYGTKPFTFRGLLRCATSGRTISADTKKKTLKSGEVREYTYLIARDPKKPNKKIWVRENKIITQLEEILKNLQIPNEGMELVKQHLKQTSNSEREFHTKRLKELQTEFNLLESRISKLTDLVLDGTITKRDYQSKRLSLHAKRDDVHAQISHASKSDNNFNKALLRILDFTSNILETFRNGDFEEKRQLLSFLFSNLELKGVTLCYSLQIPFDILHNYPKTGKWSDLVDIFRTNSKVKITISKIVLVIEKIEKL